MNADTGEGEILVEMVDAEGHAPLPGRSAGECRPLRGDHLRAAVTWGEGTAAASAEVPVRLRLHLRKARLYAFWLE